MERDWEGATARGVAKKASLKRHYSGGYLGQGHAGRREQQVHGLEGELCARAVLAIWDSGVYEDGHGPSSHEVHCLIGK